MKKGNVILIIICIVIVIIGIISMPYIYKKITTKGIDIKSDEKKRVSDIKEDITLESDILKELVYPIMHDDTTTIDSYYKNDSITVSGFSNEDILYNAYLDMYSGYINSDGSFDSNYLVSRIENIFGPKTGYNLTDFTLPSGALREDVGIFKYNAETNTYSFESTGKNSSLIYYPVKKIYEVNAPNENTINTSFYVAFVKIVDGKYKLYSDYNYTDEISSGDYTSMENIESMLEKLETKKYQYTFRKDTCNYDSYCFYEGKWINE